MRMGGEQAGKRSAHLTRVVRVGLGVAVHLNAERPIVHEDAPRLSIEVEEDLPLPFAVGVADRDETDDQALARLGLEMWGGATFDVSMRFLDEDPWKRLEVLREAIPNVLFQMLLRGANAVGYTTYPDNVVREFVKEAHARGIDLFRIFDSLNWADQMQVAIDASREAGAIAEVALCYTGDILEPGRELSLIHI